MGWVHSQHNACYRYPADRRFHLCFEIDIDTDKKEKAGRQDPTFIADRLSHSR